MLEQEGMIPLLFSPLLFTFVFYLFHYQAIQTMEMSKETETYSLTYILVRNY